MEESRLNLNYLMVNCSFNSVYLMSHSPFQQYDIHNKYHKQSIMQSVWCWCVCFGLLTNILPQELFHSQFLSVATADRSWTVKWLNARGPTLTTSPAPHVVVKRSFKALQKCTPPGAGWDLISCSRTLRQGSYLCGAHVWCLLKDSRPLHCAEVVTAFSSICTDRWAGKYWSVVKYPVLRMEHKELLQVNMSCHLFVSCTGSPEKDAYQ